MDSLQFMSRQRFALFRNFGLFKRFNSSFTQTNGTCSASIDQRLLNVKFKDGSQSQYHGIWLRDHCKCPICYHPMTRQRLLDTSTIPIDILPSKIDLVQDNSLLKCYWPDGHESIYELDWLQHHSDASKLGTPKRKRIFWDSKSLTSKLPTVHYDHVMNSDQGLSKWLELIDIYGIAFVDSVPANPIDTETLFRRIAFIRESHYGQFWDFTSDWSIKDTAYSTLALDAHTDTTYFTDPVGLQGFHLLNHQGEGGTSLFVDGFHVAQQLLTLYPESFDILTKFKISSHSAGNQNILIQQSPKSGYPILNLDPITLELIQIRFNNNDRSALQGSSDSIRSFYIALKHWIELLKQQRNEFWIQLQPGKVVIFNNWRILHGRSAFTGRRRMCGAYINMDDYLSRLNIVVDKGIDKKWL